MKRTVTICTVTSVIGCSFFVVLWPISYHLDLCKNIDHSHVTPSDCIAITKDLNVGVEDGVLWFYSGAVPNNGSAMWAIADDFSSIDQEWNFGDYGFAHVKYVKPSPFDERMCDLPGILFRRTVQDGAPPWTALSVSFLYPISLLAVMPLYWFCRNGCKAHTVQKIETEPPVRKSGG